jgi:pimeloyl-ACP methyl ester carboxylesterase
MSKTIAISSDMQNGKLEKKQGYAPVNSLSMYYEVQGTGKPLVYIPMGFGVAGTTELRALTQNRKLITIDPQGRGRTADIDRPLSFEQQADDVIALLKHLRIEQADFLGECVGGVVAILVAIRHPELVGRVVTFGSVFGKFQDAYKPEILAHVASLTPGSEVVRFQREHYERVAPDPTHWPTIWSKFNSLQWNGFSHEDLMQLEAPVLIAVGDHDWVRLDHALEIFKLIPNAELAVIPDAGHFALDAEPQKVLPVFEAFLAAPATRLPFATTAIGYQPGAAR